MSLSITIKFNLVQFWWLFVVLTILLLINLQKNMKANFYIFIFCLIFMGISFAADAQISVEFSHNRGFYTESFDLGVNISGYNVSVLYTLDGSDPAEVDNPIQPSNSNNFLIPITRSTVVRVYAYNIEEKVATTNTYIFVADVFGQNSNSIINELKYPSTWGYGKKSINSITCLKQDADYDMTVDSCFDNITQRLYNGLLEIPTMSISLNKEHIFGADSGIYIFPLEESDTCYTFPEAIHSWERKASIEIFNDVQGLDTFQFQVNAGLQMSGASTRNLDFYKHSFKLKFRSEYGASKLNYPLYGDDAADKFESLQLRMVGHCTPHDWASSRREETQFHKDNWTRSIQRQLSGYGSSPNSKFFHLFINGIYWGMYDVTERPDADYMAEYNGGLPEDYDVIKLLEVKTGTDEAYNYMHDLGHSIYDTILTDPTENPFTGEILYKETIVTNNTRANNFYKEMQNRLDIDKFIDYNLLNLYIVNTDWKENNWWAARNAKQNGKFQFFAWDAEIVLTDAGKSNQVLLFAGNSGTNLKYHPIDLNQRLLDVPEYKIKFGDHIQCNCVEEDGILNPENFLASYKSSEQKIHDAATLELARWGDARKLDPLYKTICPSVIDETLQQYEMEVFPNLLNNMLLYYGRPGGEYDLFPHYIKKIRRNNEYILEEVFNFKAVKYPKLGGEVPVGYQLELTNLNTQYNANNQIVPLGDIYYTTDGSDPRNIDGTVSQIATLYENPIPIDDYKLIKARVFTDTFKYKDLVDKTIYNLWTAMCPREFFPKGYYDDLVINEINYHPYISETVSGSNLEFLEIKNLGKKTLNISNTKFTDGIKYQFPLGTNILKNGFLLLATDSIAATDYYKVEVDGQYQGNLANNGELVVFSRPDGVAIDKVKYDDAPPWNVKPDGKGTSLSLYLDIEDKNNNHKPESWGSSAGGATPKAENVFCLPITLNVTAVNPSCYNGNDGFINIGITGGTAPYTVKWIAGSNSNTNLIENLAGGNYEVEIVDNQNCTETQKISIINPNPINSGLQITHASTINSADGYATLNPKNMPNGYSVEWSDGSSGNANYNLLAGKDYWVRIIDNANTTCSIVENFSIEVASSCAMPTNFSVTSTSNQGAIIRWSAKLNNSSYIVSYKTSDEIEWTEVESLLPNLLLNNLQPCKTYHYKIKANCASNPSNFSVVKNFTTSGCEQSCNAGVVNGNTINITSYSAFILWDIIPEANYRLNYRKNGTTTWRKYETPLNFSILFDLDNCANYQWYVEVICPDGRITSNNINNFTTADCLKQTSKPYTDNYEIEENFNFNIYPNPAQNFIKITSNNLHQQLPKSHIVIYDLLGKLVKNAGTFGTEITINIEDLRSGMYVVQIANKDQNIKNTFIKK